MFTCFLVYLNPYHRVLFSKLPDHSYQSRQVFRALRFHCDRNNRLTVMLHTFKWRHLHGRKSRTNNRILHTHECSYVTCGYLIYFYTFFAHKDACLLNSVRFINARNDQSLTFFYGSTKQSPGGNFSCMWVHRDVSNHKSDVPVSVAVCHTLPDLTLCISVPYHGNTILLCLQWIGKMLDYHVKNCFITRALLRQFLHVLLLAILIDLLKANSGLLHGRNTYGPVIQRGAKRNSAFCCVKLPFLVFLLLHALYQLVYLIYYLAESDLHLVRIHFQLVDHPINFVNEENGFHVFLHCLSQHGLCLRHRTFYGINDNHRTINGSQRPCHVTTKIHMPRSIYKVNEVRCISIIINHGRIRGKYRYPPLLFQIIKIRKELLA